MNFYGFWEQGTVVSAGSLASKSKALQSPFWLVLKGTSRNENGDVWWGGENHLWRMMEEETGVRPGNEKPYFPPAFWEDGR